MTRRLIKDELPLTLGAFNPIGHVMVGLRSREQQQQAREALLAAGFEPDDLLDFAPREVSRGMDCLVDDVSPVVGFGYESVLMKRYAKLAREGYCWLLVYAPDGDDTERLKAALERIGAPMAVKYHRLASEDLL